MAGYVFIAHVGHYVKSFAGKDYSNPRISDFHTLNKPHEDMYDRSKVPRMPWYVTAYSSSLAYLSLE